MKTTTALIFTCAVAVALVAAMAAYDRKKSKPEYDVANSASAVLQRVYTPLNSTTEACQPWEDREFDRATNQVGCRTKCPDGKFGVTVDSCYPMEFLKSSKYTSFMTYRRALAPLETACAADEVKRERSAGVPGASQQQQKRVDCVKKCPEPEYKMFLGKCVWHDWQPSKTTAQSWATASIVPPRN